MKIKRIIKKGIVISAILSLVMSYTGVKAYDIPVSVTVNECNLKMEAAPFLDNGVTYVPLRFLSDVFGTKKVEWNAYKKQAKVQYLERSITVTENKNIAAVDGADVKMNGPAVIRNGKMYVPVRFFAEMFGAKVSWIPKYYRAELTKQGLDIPKEIIASQDYSDDQIYWLAKIIHCESEGESLSGKIGVGNVIINRVLSDEFPNTIYNVIFDTKNGVQFEPILNGSIYSEPDDESFLAAKMVLEGENTVGDCMYFLNPKTAESLWIVNNRVYYTTIGNHDFYL